MNKREDIHDNFFLLQKQKIFFGEKNKTEEVSFFSFRNTHFDNSYLQDISRNSLCNFPALCLKLNAEKKKKLNQKQAI